MASFFICVTLEPPRRTEFGELSPAWSQSERVLRAVIFLTSKQIQADSHWVFGRVSHYCLGWRAFSLLCFHCEETFHWILSWWWLSWLEYQALLVRPEPFVMHSGLLGAELKKIAGEDECLHCTFCIWCTVLPPSQPSQQQLSAPTLLHPPSLQVVTQRRKLRSSSSSWKESPES